ncbi:uncharacterized protein LOC131937759 [Physella acuta]|uniref:uncharacterized protein LOC131937759 n=1 Tax=Physella acuta TaxID=109671 RepID=UPI0027DDADFB|nr:uncharacterized protein LOC131937759 [Physella acuta]
MEKIILLAFVCLLVGASAQDGKVCTDSSECGADECCQKLVHLPIMSRRQLSLFDPPATGTCEKYRHEGEQCESHFAVVGYCGCVSGLACTRFEEPLTTPVSLRSLMIPPAGITWVYKCAKAQL